MTHFYRAFIAAAMCASLAALAPAALAQAAAPTTYVVTYIEVMPSATAEARTIVERPRAAASSATGWRANS